MRAPGTQYGTALPTRADQEGWSALTDFVACVSSIQRTYSPTPAYLALELAYWFACPTQSSVDFATGWHIETARASGRAAPEGLESRIVSGAEIFSDAYLA
jgi:hypothetical protein